VAERSGVHRATIYAGGQRAPSSCVNHSRSIQTTWRCRHREPATRSRLLAKQLTVIFSDPLVVAMNGAIASGSDPELAQVAVEHWTPVFDEISRALKRAVERGEAPAAWILGSSAICL